MGELERRPQIKIYPRSWIAVGFCRLVDLAKRACKDPETLCILVYIKLTHGRHSPRCSFFRLGARVAPKCLKLPFIIKFHRYDKARACIDWLAARTKYPSRCQVGADTLSRGRMADTFIKETMSRRVLWALICPSVGFLRHRSLTPRAFIGEIPEPMTGERKKGQ